MTDDNHKHKGQLTTKFRPHHDDCSERFFLTDKPLPRVNEEWKSAQDRGCGLDPRIIAIVRLLARRAARLDYEQFVRKLMQERSAARKKEHND